MENAQKSNNEYLRGQQQEFSQMQNEFEKLKKEQAEHQAEQQIMLQGAINPYYREQSPREYLHRFLLEARQVGCPVENYIDDEIKRMLSELER